jgi:hypothetical protein
VCKQAHHFNELPQAVGVVAPPFNLLSFIFYLLSLNYGSGLKLVSVEKSCRDYAKPLDFTVFQHIKDNLLKMELPF